MDEEGGGAGFHYWRGGVLMWVKMEDMAWCEVLEATRKLNGKGMWAMRMYL